MPWASNATFLVHLDGGDGPGDLQAGARRAPAVGLRARLHRREVAAYRLSEAMGIGAVPPTVLRDDAPLGEGSLQWFVDADHREHYFTIAEQRPDLHDQLRAIAVLDVVANNTDRKSGHCLLAGDRRRDRVWAIDNGLCFATDFKLRTVIWEFAGERCSATPARRGCGAAERRAGRHRRADRRRRGRAMQPGRRGSPSTACCPADDTATATPGRSSERATNETASTS